MGERELSVLITDLKGVGDKTGKLFNKCGVFTCKDLLTYYPRDYDRFGSVLNAADAVDGSICAFKLTIIGNVTKRRVRNLSIISFEAGDQTGKIKM
ncbi:MAG: ATP-dependent DNA helicase RecG, partial [Butyrivibrio sp.]|nr:ATP-dependent DNA helicase RecG [Butyrivibrio sp.]